MQIELVDPKSLRPAAYNPRREIPSLIARLRKSIIAFGTVEPIVINADNTIIGGHQRLAACIEIGMAEVPCIRVDIPKNKEKILNVALNQIVGEWDEDMLGSLLAELRDDPQFDLTGFDELPGMAATDAEITEYESMSSILIECEDENEQTKLLHEFMDRGLKCRALIS